MYFLACDNAVLFMTEKYIQTYDGSKSNQSEIISHKISALNDVGYDFELQTVYYVRESKYLYSISMITRDKKVLNKCIFLNYSYHLKKDYYY